MPKPLPWPKMPKPPRLRQADIDHQLRIEGQPTLVRRGVICSCYDVETHNPDETCEDCDGWGFIYDADDELVDLPVQWTGHNAQAEMAQRLGLGEPGAFTVTWPSTQPLGLGDMFVHPLEEAVCPNELLRRGELAPGGAESLERLRYRMITRVEVVRTREKRYVRGVDWQLNGQTIEWLPDGDSPALGEHYGVRYGYRAHFIIRDELPKLREDGERLAYTCQVKRFMAIARQANALGGA